MSLFVKISHCCYITLLDQISFKDYIAACLKNTIMSRNQTPIRMKS